MITADVHIHTHYAHGKAGVLDMYRAARNKGLEIIGFSEHSPRPLGFDYPDDYREHLSAGHETYIAEVRALQAAENDSAPPFVLLGLEMDWLEGEDAFVARTLTEHAYDYVIGGLHFLDTWGFDSSADDWKHLSAEACYAHFAAYYKDMAKLAASGLFQMVSHPDLIKLFQVDSFHAWIERAEARELVRETLAALKKHGLALEISSAGLRKGLGEPYPGPVIMEIASELELPIFFGSDSHAADQVGYAFDQLEAYARQFGYTSSVYHVRGMRRIVPFA